MEDRMGAVRRLAGKIKKDQLLILVLVGLLLAVIAIPVEKKDQSGSSDNAQKGGMIKGTGELDPESDNDTQTALDRYEERTEQKLAEVLSAVDGVGQVQVMVTWEGSSEQQVEKDRISDAERVEEATIYQENEEGKYPYVVSWTNPKVKGVLVIAQGGGNTNVKAEILEAVQALFGIEPHKIKIMKMSK